MSERIVVTVSYSNELGWHHDSPTTYSSKGGAIAGAASAAKTLWYVLDQPTELIVKNRNGQIGKGSGSRRSYGRDPKESRG